jgi:8-oxo-dGTP pyrophosphatase MutT (NUDIX family)
LDLDDIRQKTCILIEGNYKLNDIYFSHRHSGLLFNWEEKLQIENEWNKIKKNKPSLYNGQLFHVESYVLKGSKILLWTCRSNFKEYIGTHKDNSKRLLDQSKAVRPISVGTVIITSDNKFVIGLRSDTYDYEGFYTLIAGFMDPTKDIINSRPDPFHALKRELMEEIGILENNVNSIRCVGLAGRKQPYLAFVSTLNIPFTEFNDIIPQEKEFKKLEGLELTRREIKNFLSANYSRMTPHAIENILIYYSSELSNHV